MFRLSRDYAFISSSTGGQNYIFSPSSVLACLQVAGQTGSQEARKVITKTSPGTRNGEERRGFIICLYPITLVSVSLPVRGHCWNIHHHNSPDEEAKLGLR